MIATIQRAPRPVVTGEYRIGDVRHCYAQTSKASSVFGFTSRVTLEEGLRDYVRWFQDQTITEIPDSSAELRSAGLGGGPREVEA
jgi:dTDP-L-rhamnose 4-epimerase